MIKRIGIVVCCLLLVGCGQYDSSVGYSDSPIIENDGTEVEESEEGIEKRVKSIPYSGINYNEETITLSSVEIYSTKEGYEYYPYVVINFDFSELSSEGLYWLMKKEAYALDDTFDLSVYLTSLKNDIRFESMRKIYSDYDRNSAIYIWGFLEGNKYDFEDTDLDIILEIKQDETYVYRSKDDKYGLNSSRRNKVNEYRWNINNSISGLRDIEIPILHQKDISEELDNYITEGLQNWLDFYSSLVK